jgi:hypothetical protein
MTNERWRDNELPTGGQVAWFITLYLDTLVRKDKHPHKERESIYTVDGKTRPMLVLRRLSKKERGVWWFLVLPITTKGADESSMCHAEFQPIGNCIHTEKQSFVEMRVQRIPENFFVRGSIEKPCNEFGFMNAQKIVHHKLFRTEDRSTWVRFSH